MKLLYIAGPYRGKSYNEIYHNVHAAREVAESVLTCCPDWFPITPHLNTAYMDGVADDQVFLDGDIELMKRMDAILMLLNWAESSGARHERDIAVELGIKIYYSFAQLRRGE